MNKKMVKGFFITGTGTDVGKTYVARVLAQAFLAYRSVSYMKPVQTGCIRKKKGNYILPDFAYVKQCKGLMMGPDDLHVPYRFVPACSPHCAAKMAKVTISFRHIQANLLKINSLFGNKKGCVIVEGAGGVLVPLSRSMNTMHLMAKLQMPVIIVTTPVLGTLNHTFLTVCALQSCGLTIAGIVYNCVNNNTDKFIYDDNKSMIRSTLKGVPFLELEFKHSNTSNVRGFCDGLVKRYL